MTRIKLFLYQLFFSIIKRSGPASQEEAGIASGDSKDRHGTYTRPSEEPSSTGVIHCTSCVFYFIFMNTDNICLACSLHLKKQLQKTSFFPSGKSCTCLWNSLTLSLHLETSAKTLTGCSFLL